MTNLFFLRPEILNSNQNCFTFKRRKVASIQLYLKECLDYLGEKEFCIDRKNNLSQFTEDLDYYLPDIGRNIGKKAFIEDVITLCEFFKGVSETDNLKVKLQVVQGDMCHLYHVDNIHQRLLCTYVGDGTEWVNDAFINRKRLGKGNNNRIVPDMSKVNHAQEFEVLLLRGQKFRNLRKGAVHRSPSMNRNSQPRVLLKIDDC